MCDAVGLIQLQNSPENLVISWAPWDRRIVWIKIWWPLPVNWKWVTTGSFSCSSVQRGREGGQKKRIAAKRGILGSQSLQNNLFWHFLHIFIRVLNDNSRRNWFQFCKIKLSVVKTPFIKSVIWPFYIHLDLQTQQQVFFPLPSPSSLSAVKPPRLCASPIVWSSK